MRGADYIIKVLREHSVDTVFGYPGGAIMPVYDALLNSGVRHILCRHEQGAIFAADGYARASGKLGVCLATSGPGATNLITGLANALLDSVPLLAITGQVSSDLIGTDAFQEVDTFGLSMAVTKHSFLVTKAEELPDAIQRALHIAREGRPGPVLIDVAKDVQLADIPERDPPQLHGANGGIDLQAINRACDQITSAAKPLLYAGGGVGIAGATAELQECAEKLQLPVVTTLKGIGCIPGAHPYNLGMLGMHGTKTANLSVQECDLLIAVGARFDDRATGNLQKFAPKAKVVHIDCDPAEISKRRKADVVVLGDLRGTLREILARCHQSASTDWLHECLERKHDYPFDYDAPCEGIYAPYLLKRLSEKISGTRSIVACDVGQHQMWVAQHMEFDAPHCHLSSGGLGAMGYGLPAALGAQLAMPDQMVINVTGDGSVMMNIQELATLNRYKIPVKILLLDNQRLGMVRQWQHLFFAERFSEVDLSDNPNFCEVAGAFGLQSKHIDRTIEIDSALQEFLSTKESYLLHVSINPEDNVWPLVPPSSANSEFLEEMPR